MLFRFPSRATSAAAGATSVSQRQAGKAAYRPLVRCSLWVHEGAESEPSLSKHKDPKTITRYDHGRENLDQSAVNFLRYDEE